MEILGNYDARRSEKAKFNTEKVKHWISKGAKLSDTVHNLLVERKVITGKKINNLPKKSPILSKVEVVPKPSETKPEEPKPKDEVAEEVTV